MSRPVSTLTPWEHTLIGAVAGVTEVCLTQPTNGIKNALQEGRPVPRNPLVLYRGLGINAGAMLPITATQFGVNRLLEQTLKRATGAAELGSASALAVAMGAGASSALLSGPAELVMIQQQKSGRALPVEARGILQSYGALRLYKGLSATLVRESLYSAGYLGVCPMLREYLQNETSLGSTPGAPLVVSGAAAGLLATVCTQPADTIKTRMQAFLDKEAYPQYRTMLGSARHIVETEGASTLFAGLLPRAFRLICAVIILNGTRNALVELVDLHRAEAALAAGGGS